MPPDGRSVELFPVGFRGVFSDSAGKSPHSQSHCKSDTPPSGCETLCPDGSRVYAGNAGSSGFSSGQRTFDSAVYNEIRLLPDRSGRVLFL